MSEEEEHALVSGLSALVSGLARKRRLSDLELRCQAYEELFDILRSQPENTSTQILQRIRAGADVSAVVKAIRDSDLLIHLALNLEYRCRYEFPYRDEMPPLLGNWENPYLQSNLYEKLRTLSPHRTLTKESMRDIENESERMYFMPYHAAEIVDPRISAVDASYWTTVNRDNTLLRVLLGTYFVSEYRFHPYFDKDLFLEDMVNGRTRFCSALLVNAILAAAWHGYRPTTDRAAHWMPENTGYRFFAEARRLLDLERSNATITTIQAAAIIKMAKTLNLFCYTPESDQDWQRAAAITAWGLFNWQAMHFHVVIICMFEPFIGTDTPPGEASAEAIVAESKACFETLIRLYYPRHGFESYDPSLFQFLPLLAYSALEDMRRAEGDPQLYESVRSTLVLCARGLRDQGRCYFASEAELRLLLESVGPEDAGLLKEYIDIEQDEGHLRHMAREIRSEWPIGAFSIPRDGNYRTLGNFIRTWEANQSASRSFSS
ncbi:hypothetical protein DL766_009508 [Monosporascus sp. MC13-8B]|uniref:Transcription factor domain-containing protein n=1 Tax=Monosporascus cannonballus TaxID=155416 RepID=A0ABY0GWI3_9PEZI|nr:hypothetical protein DL762_009735 [Monosporascus cannonballus]RYO77499.1 hypothetical protein DL763_009964 [Monosporascus cannonballus]RYP15047.1 hypothetical protein DL766_009508 [Monosporascus sp. MC13-8B]